MKTLLILVALFYISEIFGSYSPLRIKDPEDISVNVIKNDSVAILDNGIVRCEIKNKSGHLIQSFYGWKNDHWEMIAQSLYRSPGTWEAYGNPLYASVQGYEDDYRLFANEGFRSFSVNMINDMESEVILYGKIGDNEINQKISLKKGEDFFHIEVNGTLSGDPPKLEYLLSSFIFSPSGKPDYTYVPALKRYEDNVTGDRKFYAPAAIIQQNSLLMALVPDLDIINSFIVYATGARQSIAPKLLAIDIDPDSTSMPLVLDLTMNATDHDHPLISYGFMDYLLEQHVYYVHENMNGAMVRELATRKLKYGFDLFLRTDAQEYFGYQRISAYLWKRYGTGNLKLPRPQAMPYSEYARICYPAAINYQGYVVTYDKPVSMTIRHRSGQPQMASWQQWEMNGKHAGGFRSNDNLNHRENILYFGAHLNNVDDAAGMFYWGNILHDSSLIGKARRIINLALSAPQDHGIFPGNYDVDSHIWLKDDYHTEAASATAGFLLYYYQSCEAISEILPYVERYGDFLISNMKPDGCVPLFFDQSLKPLAKLNWNASNGAHLWVLSELYKITGKPKYREVAMKMADFMTREVIPFQKWYDSEAFYGCGNKPETFVDRRTGQYPANTQSIYWAIMGFSSLYEITRNEKYLVTIGAIADYSIFFQAIWAPHFIITAYPFGGFGVQNTDAEWLDQRNHRFATALLKAGLLTGRQDLMERAVAAAHASLTLVNHPRHLSNKIYRYPNFPLGLGPENIDHDGYPQMPLRSGPNWGETGGLSAIAYFLKTIGGVYINPGKKIAAGVDGVYVEHYEIEGRRIRIELKSTLSELQQPYDGYFMVELKIEGLPEMEYEVVINNGSVYKTSKIISIPLSIEPGGKIRIAKM